MNQDVILEIQKEFPIILNIDEKSLHFLLDNSSISNISKGTQLIAQGDTCQNISFVLKGSIRIHKLSVDGKEITLYRLGSGETCIMTASCILGGNDFPAFATAEEDSKILVVPQSIFCSLFHSSTVWQNFIFQTIYSRLSDLMGLIDEVVFKKMDRRLVEFLLSHETDGKITMTYENIAAELGTVREVISRLLKEFEKNGMLKLMRGEIKIENKDELKKFLSM